MNIEEIQSFLSISNIQVKTLHEHAKASERYVEVVFYYPNSSNWSGWIPYHYRRAGIEINTAKELAQFLETVYPFCSEQASTVWVSTEVALWEQEFSNKKVTKPFFDVLTNLDWCCTNHQFPRNNNPQRRIQDIKENGYLLATDTRRFCLTCAKYTTQLLLIPYTRSSATGYEVISTKLKNRILQVLNNQNVYEDRITSSKALIPDHKFPEIRWDSNTKAENPEDMTDTEIKEKFQLLDNQRNQQKREVCRNCYQTNKRGKVYGINYYYQGDENWTANVPKQGKEAEKGCIGCPWYDLQKWRESLNIAINKITS